MNEIIEKLKKVKDEIVLEKGGALRLSVLIARTDTDGKWDLLISGDWLEKNNAEADLIYVIDKLKKEFETGIDFISKIVLLIPTDEFFKALASAISKEGKIEGEIDELRVAPGVTIMKLYVISSNFEGLDLESEGINEPSEQELMDEQF